MLKWAAKKLGVGAMEVHLDDLAEYIETMSKTAPEERRLIAAEVLSFRSLMESRDIQVGAPIDYVRRKPAMIVRMEDYVAETTGKDRIKALGMAAWLHTLRGAKHIVDGERPEVFRELTLKMWRELGKGAPATDGVAFYPMDFDPTKG